MARINKRPSPDDESDGAQVSRRVASSPSVSFSSDKENRSTSSRRQNSKSTPTMSSSADRNPNKRRRLTDRSAPEPSQVLFQRVKQRSENKDFYDPDQPIAQRRAVRKGIRDLAKELTDSRTEYLKPESEGLADTLLRANDIFANVKQTSDATLDSRLLVNTGDLVARRAIQNKYGAADTGIDVDEFMAKCQAFMRKGPSEREANALSLSQRTQRRRLGGDADSAQGSEDEGDSYNWEWLGRKACFPHNSRPPVPHFLLGPLSVRKKIRKVTQRTQRQQRRDPADAIRPDEIKQSDIAKAENSNLTELCKKILNILREYQKARQEAAEAEVLALGNEGDVSEADAQRILEKHGLRSDCGVCYFKFAFNPKSFGQTIENIFYISFLIRDGLLGLATDDEGYLTLHPTETSSPQEIRENNIVKRQAIYHIDFDLWRETVTEFDVEECIIPHRLSHEGRQVGARSWYG